MPTVAFFLSQMISELEGYWLCLRCCHYTTYPIGLIYERHPVNMPLERLIDRLRCKKCGGLSKEIHITDEPRGLLPGQAVATHLHLLLRKNA